MNVRLIMILVIFTANLFGQTMVSGNVSGSWNTLGSPYQLTGDCEVPPGDTLEISYNTTIDHGGSFELRVRGTLIANGVTFRNGGSVFGYNGHLTLLNCSFLRMTEGLRAHGGSAAIDSCFIDQTAETGINISNTDSSHVRHCQVLNSGDYGIKISGTDLVEITDNVLEGNSMNDFSHPALFIDSCSPHVIERNTIQNNHAQGVGSWTLSSVATPVIRGNIIRRNYTGISLVNSPAFIRDNIIVANYQEGNFDSGAGIFAGYASSMGIVMGNYIAGNYYGVSNINGAALNLGDMVNDYPGDDGLNMFYDNTFQGATWNIWNGTSNTLLAQNNYWLELELTAVDATLHDNEEGSGQVIFEPIYAPAIPGPYDPNNDESTNILDVIVVIENLLGEDIRVPLDFYLTDINKDYELNIGDAVALIDIIVD